MMKLGNKILTYFILVFSLDNCVSVCMYSNRFMVRNFRVTDGYMKSDTSPALNVMDETFGLEVTI